MLCLLFPVGVACKNGAIQGHSDSGVIKLITPLSILLLLSSEMRVYNIFFQNQILMEISKVVSD